MLEQSELVCQLQHRSEQLTTRGAQPAEFTPTPRRRREAAPATMRAVLLALLLPLSTHAGFRMEGYDSGEPGSGPCESHTLSWADAHWTNVQNPHESVDDVACLDIYEDDIPVSMKIDASACSSSSSELIWMTTYDSHGCGNDLDATFNFTDGQCRKQTTDPWSCFFIQNDQLRYGHCWNIFSVRLSCWDGSIAPVTGAITFSGLSLADAQANEAVLVDTIATSAGVDESRVSISIASAARRRLADGVIVTYFIATETTADAAALVHTLSTLTTEDTKAALTAAAAENGVATTFATVTVTVVIVDEREDAAGDEDDDDAPATASTEVLLVVGILLLLVGVGAGVFISRRRPAPDAPAVIQMATHVVVDDGRMAKADPESPAPPIVAAAEEVPAPVWT